MLKFYKTTVNESGQVRAPGSTTTSTTPCPTQRVTARSPSTAASSTCGRTKGDPAQKGVTVRTRKVAHIDGSAALHDEAVRLHAFGYGFAVVEMLFGSALALQGWRLRLRAVGRPTERGSGAARWQAASGRTTEASVGQLRCVDGYFR